MSSHCSTPRPSFARFASVLAVVAVATVAVPRSALAQANWTPLARGIGADVDIDTTSVVRAGHTVTTWLRYLLGPGDLEYSLERTQIDCQAKRSRTLERRTAPTERGRQALGNAASRPPRPDSQWSFYSAGSMGASVISAVCQLLKVS